MAHCNFLFIERREIMNNDVLTRVECNENIIQVKLMNVEKNSLFVSRIFECISNEGINIDMISQVMLEDEMRIDFTCNSSDQSLLNVALEKLKEQHPRIMIYSMKNVAKLMVEGSGMKDEVGVASKIFSILGRNQFPLLQVTTSDTTISYVLEKKDIYKAVDLIKKEFNL
jgi:aspartate kinase